MNADHEAILGALGGWLERNPQQRLTQALFNLGVNEFLNPENPSAGDYALRGVYSDTDECVLARIRVQLDKFSK